MKYILLLYNIALCTHLLAQSEPQLLWQNVEFTEKSAANQKVMLDPYLNTYLITDQSFETGDQSYMLIKYAPDGTELWKRTYQGIFFNGFQDVAMDSAASVYICFAQVIGPPVIAYLDKYSTDGELLWHKRLGEDIPNIHYAEFIGLDPAGYVYAFGYTLFDEAHPDRFMYLIKLDPTDGHVIWRTDYPGVNSPSGMRVLPDRVALLNVAYTPTGVQYMISQVAFSGEIIQVHTKPMLSQFSTDFNYISSTGEVYLGSRSGGYMLTKVSVEGDTLWRHALIDEYNSATYSITEDDSLNVYATGKWYGLDSSVRMVVSKLNKDGTLLWESVDNRADGYYGSAGSKVFVHKTCVYVAGVAAHVENGGDVSLKVLNAQNGEELAQIYMNISTQNGEWASDIWANDSLIVFAAYSNDGGQGHDYAVTGMFRFDKTLSATGGEISTAAALDIFPNPSIGAVNVRGQSAAALIQRYQIQSIDGRLLAQGTFDAAVPIDVRGLGDGAYFLVLEGKGLRLSRKFVKME